MLEYCKVLRISIHAPRAGCDACWQTFNSVASYFNPRTPCGVRPGRYQAAAFYRGTNFNPRTPCGVRRGGPVAAVPPRKISIHAPRAGCDDPWPCGAACPANFNPRTPCGVRPLGTGTRCVIAPFQSTHPVRGATFTHFWPPPGIGIFQSTHPVRGATVYNGFLDGLIQFQSTHPVRGATSSGPIRPALPGISIHAPRAGCDYTIISSGDNP